MTLDPSRMKKGGLLVVPLIVAGLVGHGCARKTDAIYGIYRAVLKRRFIRQGILR